MRTLIISGKLYKDPEQKQMQNGKTFCVFSICDSKKRGGQDDIMWCRVTVFGKTAEVCMQYLHAKDYVTVVGDPSIYVNKDNKGSIELLANQVDFGPKGSNSGNGGNGGDNGYQQPQGGYAQQGGYQQGGYQQQPPPSYNLPPTGGDGDNGDSPF